MKRRKFRSVIGVSMAWLMLMTSGLAAYASGLGDINGDSLINAVDASEILSEYARVSTNQKAKLTDEQKKCADVDKNGDINAVDASQVLSYYAYKSTSGTMEFEAYLKNPPVTTTRAAASTTTTTTTTAAAATTAVTTTTAPVETVDITGKWSMEEFEHGFISGAGLIFNKDGSGDLFEDTSELMCFNDKGLVIDDTTITSDNFSEDNGVLKVSFMGHDLIEMKRLEKKNGYDGLYNLCGGEFRDVLLTNLTEGKNLDKNSLNIDLLFENGHSEVIITDVFRYETAGKMLFFTDYNELLAQEGEMGYTHFSIEGDTLILYDNDVDRYTYKRVK